MIAHTTVIAAVTVVVTTVVVVYYDVRCPNCNRRVMSLPHRPPVDTVAHRAEHERTGRGIVVSCARCKSLVEAIPHAA